MAEVTIRGKKFPLCLTVAALDKINDKCGSLDKFVEFLHGGGAMNTIMINTAWALGVLLAEGEENRLMCARLDGEKAERRAVPNEVDIIHLLTIGAVNDYRASVFAAVNESMTQKIEAVNSKNADQAEQG